MIIFPGFESGASDLEQEIERIERELSEYFSDDEDE